MKPYRPDGRRPWNRKRAAHLLRRGGFAPTQSEIEAALKQGPAETVDRLVDARRDSEDHDDIDRLGERIALGSPGDAEPLRQWWLTRACRTSRPLSMRISLFWMNHFATSNAKVKSAPLMLKQLRSIERHGMGRFEDLLLALSRDPAMILWLDGDRNLRGRPNENYARELFELFSLGVGNYTEQDIREAARAFTGWHQKNGRFLFAERDHDREMKVLFGERGNLNGDDVVRLCLSHPSCSRFIGRKLAFEFIEPHPCVALVDAIAATLRETGFDMKETLRTLLKSDALEGSPEQALRLLLTSPEYQMA